MGAFIRPPDGAIVIGGALVRLTRQARRWRAWLVGRVDRPLPCDVPLARGNTRADAIIEARRALAR